jgi:Alginate lyase
MNRRTFLTRSAALAAVPAVAAPDAPFTTAQFDRARVLRNAAKYLIDKPVTVTAAHSPRSSGGLHDFFSEGDYWWPDPKNPASPYIQRDGMTNPDNFTGHREFLMKLSVQAPALTAAWKLTKDRRYADHAAAHIRAWFVDEATPSTAKQPGAAPASSTPFIWWKLPAPFRSSPMPAPSRPPTTTPPKNGSPTTRSG